MMIVHIMNNKIGYFNQSVCKGAPCFNMQWMPSIQLNDYLISIVKILDKNKTFLFSKSFLTHHWSDSVMTYINDPFVVDFGRR